MINLHSKKQNNDKDSFFCINWMLFDKICNKSRRRMRQKNASD